VLIYWIQDNPTQIGKTVLLVQDGVWARRLRQIDNNSFAFMVKKGKNDAGQIKKIQIQYVMFQTVSIYQEDNPDE
jgi:hypothetical protein